MRGRNAAGAWKDAGKKTREVSLLFISAACLIRQIVTRMIRQMLFIKGLWIMQEFA